MSQPCFYHHYLVAENNTAKFKAQDENRGMGRGKQSSQPAWDGNHFKDARPHRRSVPWCVRSVWKAEMAAVWVPAKATSGRNVGKIRFFTQPSQGEWRENREAKKEDEKLRGCIKKMMDWWLSKVGLIISLHSWVLKVCLGQKYSQDAELKIAFGLLVQY